MEKMIRTFVAVPISDSVKGEIADFLNRIKRSNADVRWVKPESVHITLKFLGDVDPERIESIRRCAQEAVQSVRRFSVRLAGTGAFPNDKRPRVLWIGITEGSAELKQAASRIDEALCSFGFEKEKRPFSPHLTVGRVRSPKSIENAIAEMKMDEFDAGSFEADSVLIMQSDLHPDGAVHTPLATIKLQG